MDGARERLSEQQFNRLVDYIAKTSCHLAPSCSSMQTACSVVAVELPPATVRTYHYLADPHSAQVFVSRFTMVKNRALRKGFPWVPLIAEQQSSNIQHGHKANMSIVTGILILQGFYIVPSPQTKKKKDTPPSSYKERKFKWEEQMIRILFSYSYRM